MNRRTSARIRLRARHVHDAPLPRDILRAYVECCEIKLRHSERPRYLVAAVGTGVTLLALSLNGVALSSEVPLVITSLLLGYGLLGVWHLLSRESDVGWSRHFAVDLIGILAWAIVMDRVTSLSLVLCYASAAAVLIVAHVPRGNPDAMVTRTKWLAVGVVAIGLVGAIRQAGTPTFAVDVDLIVGAACLALGIACLGWIATGLVQARRRRIQRKTIASLERVQQRMATRQGTVISA